MSSSENIKVCFRADGSSAIGTGHIMRCYTLAMAMHSAGFEVSFCTRSMPKAIAEKINHDGINVHWLPLDDGPFVAGETNFSVAPEILSDWRDDAHLTLAYCKTHDCDWLIVDHYMLDARFETIIRQANYKILVIDDLANRDHDCDLLMDQTIFRQPSLYQGLVPADCFCMTGTDYALLRPEFAAFRQASLARRRQGTFGSLLISMGGADQNNYTFSLFEAISDLALPQSFKITIICGPYFQYSDDVRTLSERVDADISILHSADNMAELMATHDLMITAGGTTNWERLCMGMPGIVAVVASNQKDIVQALSDHGLCDAIDLQDRQAYQSAIQKLITNYLDCPDLLQHSGERAASYVDGKGTNRVIDAIGDRQRMNVSGKNVTF